LACENKGRRWRKLHNEELYGLYTTPNIIKAINLRMRRAGHAERMGKTETHTDFL
jgi:hypothetical protein